MHVNKKKPSFMSHLCTIFSINISIYKFGQIKIYKLMWIKAINLFHDLYPKAC